MKHLVVTRLNLPFRGSDAWRDKSWVEDRLAKLERLSAPSIHAQDCQDFEYWVVACRTDDPEIARNIETGVARAGANLAWLTPGESGAFRNALSRAVGPDDLEVAVTRVDSDDILHPSFVRRVQSEFDARTNDFFVINPLIGLMCIDGRLAIWPYVASNFLTSVHRRHSGEDLRTAYDFSHDQVHAHAPVVQIVSRPLWLFSVHGNNTVIDVMRGVHVPSVWFRRRFSALSAVEMKRWSPLLTVRSGAKFLRRMRSSDSSARVKSLVSRSN